MNHNDFQRFFMIFKKEGFSYETTEKELSGHLKIIVRDGKGKLEGNFSGLDIESNYIYTLYLISVNDKTTIPVKVKKVIPSGNITKIQWKFNPVNVDNSNIKVNDFNVAALVAYNPVVSKIVCPLIAYKNERENWKKEIMKAINLQYSMIANDLTTNSQSVVYNQLTSDRPKPRNIMPKPTDKPIEIRQLRARTNKYYINPDKTFSVQVASSPVYFKNRRGKLEDIDNELISTDEPGYSYTNKENSLKVFLATDNNNGKLVKLQIKNKKWIDFSPNETFSMNGRIEKNSIYYRNSGNNTELSYYIDGNRLKEEIVFLNKPPTNIFDFNITTEGLYLEKDEDGFVWIKDSSNEENVLRLIKPAAFDDKGEVSRNITMEIVYEGNIQKLLLTIDNDWLKSAKYPVRIDPTITETLQPGAVESRDTFASDAYPETKYYDDNYLHAGTRFGKTRSFIKFENLPQLGSVVKEIKKAYLKLYMYFAPQTADNTIIDLHQVTEDWQSTTLDWTDQPSYKITPEYSIQSKDSGEWTFDITNLVNKWYSTYPSYYGQAANYGIMLKARDESNERRSFYSGDSPSNQPKLVIEYETDPIGIEPFWYYDGDVNVHSGNLSFSQVDVTLPGRGIPISVIRTYNSRASMYLPYIYGYGWSYNIDAHLNYVDGGIVTFTNSDGTKYFFAKNNDGTYKSPPGVKLNLKSESGIYYIETRNGIKYYIDSYGRLDYIIDTYENTTNISYDMNGNISSISDPSGRSITFDISNGKLRNITGNEIPTVEYGYDALGNLTSVIKRDPLNQSILDEVYYAYEDPNDTHNITSIIDAENNTTDIEYYNDDKVKYVVKDMTTGGNILTLITQYEYSFGPNDTTITTVTYPRGNKVQYTTNLNGNLIEKIYNVGSDPDDFNLTTNLQWDAEQNIVDISNPKNYSYIFGYNEKGNIEQLNIPGNYSAVRHYNTLGDIIDSTDFSSRTNIENYNSETRSVASSSNPWFSSNIYDYDEYGNIIQRTNLLSIGENLLHNPGFENWSGELPWHWVRPNTGGSIIDESANSVNGIHSVKMISTGTQDSDRARLQSIYIPVKPKSKYNISWDIKTDNVGSTNGGATVTIYWFANNDGSPEISTSYTDNSIGTEDWIRKGARVDSPSNAAYAKVEISVNDAGTAWFDSIQFLLGSVINDYNILINSDFEQLLGGGPDPDYWQGFNLNVNDGVDTTFAHSGSRSVVINGEASINKYFQQVIKTQGPEGVIFRFSGWTKSEGTFTAGPYLGISLVYEDDTVQYFGITFSTSQHDWEYKEESFITEKAFKEIRIYGKLENQTGTVWYDDFNLRLSGAPNALINEFNLVENGSFEYDIDETSWPDGWPKYTNSDNVPGIYDVSYISASGTIDTFHGDKMIRISDVPSWAYVGSYSVEPLKIGEVYTACVAIKTENVTGSGAIIKIDILDSNDVYLGDKKSTPVKGTNDWKRIATTITENEAKILYSNAAKISVSVGTDNATNGAMYFDAILFREGRVETDYDYGNTNGNYITSITNPRGNKVDIVPTTRGNIEQITDSRGNTSTFEYNLIDQLKYIITPTNLKTELFYDDNGNITQIDYVDNIYSSLINSVLLQYNQLGFVLNATDQISKMLTFEYTSNTNIDKIIKPDGEIIQFLYDSADRLDSVTYSQDVRTWAFEYDDNSNITQIIQTATEITQFDYDELDRVTKITYPDTNHFIEYVYNPNHQILNLSYSKIPAQPILYNYDQSGLNVKVNGFDNSVTAYMYDQEGKLIKSYRTSAGNTYYITYIYYDQTGNIMRLRTEDGTGNKVTEYVYTYDDNGNRESEHNTVTDEYSTFSYDLLNQLIDEKYYYNKEDQTPYRHGVYEYDLLGNLESRVITVDGNVIEKTFTYNLANEVSNGGYTYDENGNLTSDGYRTYVYNASDQLILVKEGENIIAEYEYNALGLRSRKEVSSVIERYYYSGNQLSYITDDNGEIKLFFTYDASGQRLNMIDYTGASGAEETYWYEYDAHGNVIGLLDKDGTIVVNYKYDAWGNILSSTGIVNTADGLQNLKDANPFRYSGYFYDLETIFYYLKARYYAPYLQRFITRDVFIGMNPYLYTLNNPVGRIDPNGNTWLDDAVSWLKNLIGIEEKVEIDAISGAAPVIPPPDDLNVAEDMRKMFREGLLKTGADEFIDKKVIGKIPIKSTNIISIPKFGAGARVESITFRPTVKTTRLIKGVGKYTGPVAIGSFLYDLSKDYNRYSGEERIMAMTITTGGSIISVAIGVGIGFLGFTAAPAIAIGALTGMGVGLGVEYVKTKYLSD